jgi:alpha-ketoglutarate-dependent taurine dioxygenase
MGQLERNTDAANSLRSFRRKAVSLSPETLVRVGFLQPGDSFPLLMEPKVAALNGAQWARNNLEMVETELLKHGAILFRNFNLNTAADFEQFVRAVTPDLLDYGERSSPRALISPGVYTSTEHPEDQFIHFHNEQSYTLSWPMKLWFFCEQPPVERGATPIADGRGVLARLSARTKEKFISKKVLYVRNYNDGMGLTWQTAFQTTSRAAVEEYCRQRAIGFEWKDGDRLRTKQVFSTIVRHPKTGEAVWFEHAAFFHISSLKPSLREMLLSEFSQEELPFNTYYGDGSPIEDEVLEEIREAYNETAYSFSWQKGDLLLIDNMLTSHGREPFKGPRKILVAMAGLFHSVELLG